MSLPGAAGKARVGVGDGTEAGAGAGAGGLAATAAAPAAVPESVAAVLGGSAPTDRTFTPLTHSQLNLATGGVWRVTGPLGSAVLKLCVPGTPPGPVGPGTAADPGTADTSADPCAADASAPSASQDPGAGMADASASPASPGTADASGSAPVPDGWAGSPDPRHWNHWRREPLAYLDGLPTTAFADAEIEGPRLLAADTRPDGSFALWLEDVSGPAGSRWTVPRIAAFAHALGTAQAPWTDRLPDRPWLSRGWLRQYVSSKSIPAHLPWDHPTAVAVWPTALRTGLRRLWESRDTLLTAAESTPRTLCHLDVWLLNLLSVDTPTGAADRTVLLDWAFVGEGGVGEDIANLIPDCVADGLMPTELLPEISETVIEGYLNGLRDGGHRTNADTLRRSVAAAGAAKYCWLAPLMLTRLAAGTPVGSAAYDVGGDDTAVLRRRIGLFEHLVDWSDRTLGPR